MGEPEIWTERLERWVAGRIEGPGALRWLTAAAAIENTVVPLTLEPIVVPLMALYPKRAFGLAAAMAIGSTLGGVVMYAVGAGLADALVRFVPALAQAAASADGGPIATYGFWAILLFAATPLPYQVATVGAGAVGYPFLPFLLAVVLGRTVAYAILATAARLASITAGRALERYRHRLVPLGLAAGAAAVVLPVLLVG